MTVHSSGLPRYVESPIPLDERRRVRWRDDAGASHDGVMVKRRRCRGDLVMVLVRSDRDPGRLVAVCPNDLEDVGPAVPRIPPVPAGASVVVPLFARRRPPVFLVHETAVPGGGA